MKHCSPEWHLVGQNVPEAVPVAQLKVRVSFASKCKYYYYIWKWGKHFFKESEGALTKISPLFQENKSRIFFPLPKELYTEEAPSASKFGELRGGSSNI